MEKNIVAKKSTKPIDSAFTFKGYNASPQPCLENKCSGLVKPTWNANVGKCNSCETRYNWAQYWKQREDYKIKDKP